ncbi:MAG: nitronate monooxygenase [Bacteroidota bacterium]
MSSLKIKNQLTEMLGIDFPMIMAPMFLVSNFEMISEAMKNGIAGTFPSLNFRKENELDEILLELNKIKNSLGEIKGNYGVNIIVQKTNILFEKHLDICTKHKVPFYITSLGNPAPVIKAAKTYGGKVFCDVTNLVHAKKCAEEGCDGFIAVGQGAGGHAGPNPLQVLVPALIKIFPDIPVIAAGGIATGGGVLSCLALGASGVSVGTRFISSTEAKVSNEYKQAINKSGMDDIVMTTKISGTPCTIINTDYAKKIGYEQNWLEKKLSNNSTTKKYFKMLVQFRGMKKLEDSVLPANYKTLWCAGKSAELIDETKSCKEIIDSIIRETKHDYEKLKKTFQE